MPWTRLNWAEQYFEWLWNHRKKLHFVLILVTLVFLGFSTRLKLKTDFATLLPNKLTSVKNLNLAAERIGGTGALLIGVESPSFAANKKFMNAFAEKLLPLQGQMLRYVEFKYQESRKYLQSYGLHYLSNEQLEKFQKFLERSIQKQKDKSVGSFLGLDDKDDQKSSEPEEQNELTGLNPQLKSMLDYPDAYLGSKDGKLLVMFARPLSSSLGVEKNREILTKIKSLVAELNPSSFHPQMFVGYGGNVVSSIDEVETVKADLLDTALLLVALILGTLFLFLWSWRLIALICLTLIISVTWTFGITQIFIGYLNTQTAFLGSLVVGTGINYGVIFVSRYIENRRAHLELRPALIHSLRDTLIATLIASSTTAISFVCLFLAQNKGLSQFGFIGSIGVAFCWLFTYSLLPIWLYWWESKKPNPGQFLNPAAEKVAAPAHKFAQFYIRNYKGVLGISLLVTIISLWGVSSLVKDPLEKNFDRLRNKITKKAGVAAFEKKMQTTLPTSRTPAPVMLESIEEAQEICPLVEKIASEQPQESLMIHQCMSLYKLLPSNYEWTPQRKMLFEKVQKTLGDPLLKHTQQGEVLVGIHEYLSYRAPQVSDLPEEIRVRFREKDGTEGKIAFISPRPDKTLSDADNLFNFVDPLSKLHFQSSGRTVSAAGDSFVLADLFRSVPRDGSVVGISAFIGVVLIAMFLAGGIRAGLLMSLCLALATIWLFGLQGFFHERFNFFNFIALPLTFGIGVDYPINMFLRCKQEGFKNFPRVLMGSGVAVILCSLTTTIGYLTLVGATNQALVSFAVLALIGEVACLMTAIFVLPAILRAFGKFKDS